MIYSTILDPEYVQAILNEWRKELDNTSPITKPSTTHGMKCKDCKEDFPYAEANQKDGSFICYSCRKGF